MRLSFKYLFLFLLSAACPAAVPVAHAAEAGPLAHAAGPRVADVKEPSSGPAAGSLNLAINYPGGALRYFTAEGKAVELFGQGQDKIFTGGLRYYYYPAGLGRGDLFPYVAAEADFASFKGRYSKGTGIGGGLFGGVEYFLGRKISLQTDIGALYMSIQDKDTSLGESGLEFIMNFGFNYYFGGGKR